MPAAHIVSHNPATVHAPAGGYSMGFEISQHRRLLFVSGQVPETSDGSVPEGFEAQCEQAWRNVIEVLAAAGLGVRHLVKVTTFLTEIVHMPEGEVKMLQSQSSWSGRVAAAQTIPRELRAAEGYRFDPVQFKAFKVSTLLLLGGDSPAFFKAAIEVVHAALPSSRLVILPGPQPVAMNTAPALFLNEVLTFIAD